VCEKERVSGSEGWRVRERERGKEGVIIIELRGIYTEGDNVRERERKVRDRLGERDGG